MPADLPGAGVEAAAAVLGLLNDGDARATLRDAAVVCPHFADSEVAHALRARVLRGDAEAVDASRIWDLRDNLSGYDATYVALAEALEALLVTADGRLARAPEPRCTVMVVRR